jgi:hypothetical protein
MCAFRWQEQDTHAEFCLDILGATVGKLPDFLNRKMEDSWISANPENDHVSIEWLRRHMREVAAARLAAQSGKLELNKEYAVNTEIASSTIAKSSSVCCF